MPPLERFLHLLQQRANDLVAAQVERRGLRARQCLGERRRARVGDLVAIQVERRDLRVRQRLRERRRARVGDLVVAQDERSDLRARQRLGESDVAPASVIWLPYKSSLVTCEPCTAPRQAPPHPRP